MNYEKYENLAITIQNMFTLKLMLVNRYYTLRKSQTYMKNVNYNYFISQNKTNTNYTSHLLPFTKDENNENEGWVGAL
jgi:hypothetical protein